MLTAVEQTDKIDENMSDSAANSASQEIAAITTEAAAIAFQLHGQGEFGTLPVVESQQEDTMRDSNFGLSAQQLQMASGLHQPEAFFIGTMKSTLNSNFSVPSTTTWADHADNFVFSSQPTERFSEAASAVVVKSGTHHGVSLGGSTNVQPSTREGVSMWSNEAYAPHPDVQFGEVASGIVPKAGANYDLSLGGSSIVQPSTREGVSLRAGEAYAPQPHRQSDEVASGIVAIGDALGGVSAASNTNGQTSVREGVSLRHGGAYAPNPVGPVQLLAAPRTVRATPRLACPHYATGLAQGAPQNNNRKCQVPSVPQVIGYLRSPSIPAMTHGPPQCASLLSALPYSSLASSSCNTHRDDDHVLRAWFHNALLRSAAPPTVGSTPHGTSEDPSSTIVQKIAAAREGASPRAPQVLQVSRSDDDLTIGSDEVETENRGSSWCCRDSCGHHAPNPLLTRL